MAIFMAVPLWGWGQSPGNVSGNLQLWLKADAGVTGTSTVTQWNDQSGNGFNATATSGPELLTDRVNFNPALDFDGSTESIAVTNGIFGTSTVNDAFVYIVNRTNTTKNSTVFRESMASGERFLMHLTWGDANVYYDVGTCCTSSRVNTNWGGSTGQFYLWTAGSSTGTSTPSGTRKSIYRNGLSIVTNDQNDGAVGANNDHILGNGDHDGEIAEYIVYTGVPTTAEQNRIHSYLAVKYGITLDQSSAQVYFDSNGDTIFHSQSGGDFDAYDNDITGIGRDDNSGLDQRKSVSSNASGVAMMEKTSAFTSDRDFMMWGDDGNSLGSTTIGAHPSYPNRTVRAWRVDLSGTPGTVSVSFLLSTGIGNTGNAADYALLIDGTDTDFSSGATAHTTGASISGDTLTFTNVSFSDGDFFSLARPESPTPGGVAADVRLWMIADSGVTGTSNVTQWVGRSGYGRVATSATGPEVLTDQINGHQTLQFNGSNEYLSVAGGLLGSATFTEAYVYLVFEVNTIQASSVFRETVSGSNGRFGCHLPWSDSRLYYDVGQCCGDPRVSNSWGGSTNTPYVYSLNSSAGNDTPSGIRQGFFQNGQFVNGDVSSGSMTGINSDFFIGASNASSSEWAGDMAEIIVITSAITAADQDLIETYLGVRYGITMAHDYISDTGDTLWNYTTNVDYNNDIAGIGRDDNSGLRQDSTRNISSTAILSVYNPSGLDNDEYLIWGHSGQSQTAGTSGDLPSGIQKRLSRVWRFEMTGDVGTVDLKWDTTGWGAVTLTDIRLLIDRDGDGFADGDVAPISGAVAGSIGFNNVSLQDGDLITIGTVNSTQTPLPVEMLSFDAELDERGEVALSWATASESNSDHFVVERSANTANWEPIWIEPAAGFSNREINYDAIDHEPLGGTSYYRLRQVDLDGSVDFSSVRAVEQTQEVGALRIYPNPASDQVRIELPENVTPGNISLSLIDLSGRQIPLNQPMRSNQGQALVMDLTLVESGTYLLQVYDDFGHHWTEKLTVHHR